MRLFSAFSKVFFAVGLLVAMWGLSALDRSDRHTWVHPAGASGPVRILQFYASTGIVAAGEKARLCYSVENAKSVRISPMMQEVYPFPNHCLEIEPEHTTHYTLLAEGYDGTLDARSLTLPVQAAPPAHAETLNVASLVF